jgi:hypothetical protein
MMAQVFQSAFRVGSIDPIHFNASNTPGDQRHQEVKFVDSAGRDAPMPGPAPGKRKGAQQVISVIVTAVKAEVAVVPCAAKISSAGFTFFGRNADPRRGGDVRFSYMAVLAGIPDNTRIEGQLEARLQVLQSKQFNQYLDRDTWPRIWYSEPYATKRPKTPLIFLSANNLNVESQNPAVTGWSDELAELPDLLSDGFSVRAMNVDSVGGHSGFYATSFILRDLNDLLPDTATQNIWIDQGSEDRTEDYFRAASFGGVPYPLNPGGKSGDTRSLDIYFDHPFLVPPIVLATGREENPVVPMIRNVTTHGFTAGVRNTDSVARHALINWVAFGCSDGCG